MDRKPVSTAEAAARLSAALNDQGAIGCAEAEPLIPQLLEAERAGEDVDRNPAYAALLRHLDRCAGCLSLYEQLAEDLESVVGEAEVLPSGVPLRPPTFFSAPVPKGDYVLLQVLAGIVRRFTLAFDMPRLAPVLPTLSGSQRALFSDTLGEVAGHPLLALTAGRGPEGLWLQVALREPGRQTAWQIRLDLGEQTLTTTTDARGIARFSLPPAVPLGSVRMSFEELPTPESTWS